MDSNFESALLRIESYVPLQYFLLLWIRSIVYHSCKCYLLRFSSECFNLLVFLMWLLIFVYLPKIWSVYTRSSSFIFYSILKFISLIYFVMLKGFGRIYRHWTTDCSHKYWNWDWSNAKVSCFHLSLLWLYVKNYLYITRLIYQNSTFLFPFLSCLYFAYFAKVPPCYCK